MEILKGFYMPFAYLFWGLQTYCMYFMATKIGSEPFTVKVMMVTMVAYLTLPHLYYYLNQRAEEKYEN
jgi:TctA family transporter